MRNPAATSCRSCINDIGGEPEPDEAPQSDRPDPTTCPECGATAWQRGRPDPPEPPLEGPRPVPPSRPQKGQLRLIVLINGDEIEPDSDTKPYDIGTEKMVVNVRSMHTVIYKHAIAYLRYW